MSTPRRAVPPRVAAIDFDWIRSVIRRYGLALWFLLLTGPTILSYLRSSPVLFFDSRLYVEATRAWLAGGDPWSVSYRDILFAAPPPTLLPLVPFAVLPGDLGWIALGAACVAGGLATLRTLDLPWWWLLFPPMVLGMASGNIQLLLIPLILWRSGWLAGLVKVYGLVPVAILGRWRQLAGFGLVLVVTAPILPWDAFVGRFGEINAALAGQSHYGLPTLASVALLPVAAVAMWIVGRERSAWLAVPALWPYQQWYYATLAIPARSQLAAFVIAVPVPGSGALGLLVLAVVTWVQRRRERATTEAATTGPAATPAAD